MEEYNQKIKKLYIALGVLAALGTIVLLILGKRQMISGFLLGAIVNVGLIALVEMRFKQLYKAKQEGENTGAMSVLTGSLPKLLIMLVGVLLCKYLPSIFDMFGYAIGLALYALTFISVGVIENIQNKKAE